LAAQRPSGVVPADIRAQLPRTLLLRDLGTTPERGRTHQRRSASLIFLVSSSSSGPR
jgi:hypothetical protein